MHDDDIDRRLVAAEARLASLAPALRTGGPWPLAERFDHAPEASWGPPEVLAHLAEMLPYWLGEVERIVAAEASPEPFGRIATDERRIAVIDRDRTLPIPELEARVAAGLESWRRRWAELDATARSRRGLHPARGEMTVAEVAERMIASHLDDHLDQLAATLTGDAATG